MMIFNKIDFTFS